MRGDSCMIGRTIPRRASSADGASRTGPIGPRLGSGPAGDDLGVDDQVVAVLDPRLDQRLALEQPPPPSLWSSE